MPFLKFQDNNIFYDTEGSGAPLLLLHGNCVSARMFDSEIKYFSHKYKVIYFDYPGMGRSSRIKKFDDNFWKYNAQCAVELLKLLDISEVKVIGTSGGAKVGINLAMESPQFIDKLIADSFLGEYLTISEAERIKQMRIKGKSQILTSAFWKKMHGDDWETIVNMDIDLMLNTAYNNLNPISGNLSEIICPVLITASREDELIPNIEARMQPIIEKIPDARFKIYDKGKHPLMITRKKLFRDIADNFLES